ncbi:choice-of-anchor H family protein [Lentisalinibacter salinarum]|uniref:choice-of-anchor H family protein n=1 Tax=Lentisalinibacter salinarum TaxID=2992239 RepID=UPI003863FD14
MERTSHTAKRHAGRRSSRALPDWPARWFPALVVAAALTVAAGAFAADASGIEPQTRTADGFAAERGDSERRPASALEAFEGGGATAEHSKTAPSSPEQRAVSCCGFRIYDAQTRLFDDLDRDGYYTWLQVTFDVDTDYTEADVYADIWLREPGGSYTLIHETDVFTIRGSSSSDDYEVEAELVAGFPPGLYDVLIEVYDAWDDRFVADFDAADSSDLGLLPLEDISFDGDVPPPVVYADGSGGSGSFSLTGLAALAGLGLWRRRRHSFRGPAGR